MIYGLRYWSRWKENRLRFCDFSRVSEKGAQSSYGWSFIHFTSRRTPTRWSRIRRETEAAAKKCSLKNLKMGRSDDDQLYVCCNAGKRKREMRAALLFHSLSLSLFLATLCYAIPYTIKVYPSGHELISGLHANKTFYTIRRDQKEIKSSQMYRFTFTTSRGENWKVNNVAVYIFILEL